MERSYIIQCMAKHSPGQLEVRKYFDSVESLAKVFEVKSLS